jgi:beta-lactamase superfamily II metal-dependent hydrolase
MRQVFIAAVFVVLFVASFASAQTLRIYHVDVEQADSALIVMPNGKTLLIDSGNNKQGKRIKAVMDQAGVTRIDAFVASHYHADHFGGIDDLVKGGIPVLESYDRGRRDLVDPADKENGTYKDYMATVGEDAHALEPGDTITLDPLVTVTCIAASGAVIGGSSVSSSDENDLSVSLLVEFAGFKAFFGGDTHALVENIIASGDLVTNVDLYKSNHHGSETSSSAAFMSDLKPTVIVISNGSHGSYHHPRQATLDTYNGLTPAPVVLQTNRCKLGSPCGNVGPAMIADPEMSGKSGTIQIVVDAVSRSYEVRYGVSTIRTFAFKASAIPVVGPSSASTAVIQSLLPNPAGDDEQLEEVTIRNTGSVALPLNGWILRDRSDLTWALTGTLQPGESGTFRRLGQAMSLNNGGDEIVLVDPASVERDRFSYLKSSQGVRISTNH